MSLDDKQGTSHCQASPSPTRTSHRASARPNPNLQQEGLPLIQPLKRAEFFAVSNIRRRLVFGEPGMQRREIPEIPREAVRPGLFPEGGALETIWREETAASSSATRAHRAGALPLGNNRAVRHGHPSASSDIATPRA